LGNRYTFTEEFRREAVELARSSDRLRYKRCFLRSRTTTNRRGVRFGERLGRDDRSNNPD
jgi:hypothetical protein